MKRVYKRPEITFVMVNLESGIASGSNGEESPINEGTGCPGFFPDHPGYNNGKGNANGICNGNGNGGGWGNGGFWN